MESLNFEDLNMEGLGLYELYVEKLLMDDSRIEEIYIAG